MARVENRGSHPNSRKNLTYRIAPGSDPWNKGMGWVYLDCPYCGKTNHVLASQSKGFCNRSCVNKWLRKPPATYGSIHNWVRRNFGTPSKCEHCGTTESKKFEWANISHQYKLIRSDWRRLCCQCHRRLDRGTKNKIEVT